MRFYTSVTAMVRSSDPDISNDESGEKVSDRTPMECALDESPVRTNVTTEDEKGEEEKRRRKRSGERSKDRSERDTIDWMHQLVGSVNEKDLACDRSHRNKTIIGADCNTQTKLLVGL